MSNNYKLAHSLEGYPRNLSFFKAPLTDMVTGNQEVLIYSPKNDVNDSRTIYELTGLRNQLIKLDGLTMHITGTIVYEDGTPVADMPSGSWNSTAITDAEKTTEEATRQATQKTRQLADVSVVNNLYNSLYKDGIMSVQGARSYSNEITYRGWFDTIVNNKYDVNFSKMTQFYTVPSCKCDISESIIEGHDNFNQDSYALYQYTKNGNEIEMCGQLPFDLCDQEKYFLIHTDVMVEMNKQYL